MAEHGMKVGGYAKVWFGENRLWFEITAVDGETLMGKLRSNPAVSSSLSWGCLVKMAAADVIDYEEDPSTSGESGMNKLQSDIKHALNRACAENESNTPDFILAKYMLASLDAFNRALNERSDWYGRHDEPGKVGGSQTGWSAMTTTPEWATIESAPRDGTEVLVYCRNDVPEIVAAFWTGEPSEGWAGWIFSDEALSDIQPEGPSPTHWMYPPEPPK